MEYKSQEELYRSLKGAFRVKERLIGDDYLHLKPIDIWNYLKINKWSKAHNLSISEIVNDIIDVDITKVDAFKQNYIKNIKKTNIE